MFNLSSVRARLISYYLLSVAILIGVSSYALVQMLALDRLTETLDRKWVVGTRLLGEMADLLSETRLAETRLALATDQDQTDRALAAADGYIVSIGYQRTAYGLLDKTQEELGLLAIFDREWSTWAAEHRAWAALSHDPRLAMSPAFQLRAHALYEIVDDTVDTLSTINAAGAAEAGARADNIVDTSGTIFAIVVACALVLASWVTWVIHAGISRPLASITKALSELAAGNRDVVIPQVDRHDEIGSMALAFEVFRNNAVALEESQALAETLARYDALTGLANRRVLSDELNKALSRVERGDASFAVLLIDLDRFKPVNDIHGHSAGDFVLGEITTRLKAVVRKNDTLARIGGDEFAIICELDVDGRDLTKTPIALAERIISAISAPITIAARIVEVGASVGIALCPADGMNGDALMHAADIAMYRAKQAGRGTFRFYEESMDTELKALAALEADIQRAVAANEIEPHYQPLIELSDGRLLGFEILARWHHPEKGMIAPDVFIPIIERLGLMSEFSLAMLRRACIDAKEWPADLRLSLNVSPRELSDLLFPIRLLAVLSEQGFTPNRLEIEITENALVADLETAKTILQSLQNVGIKIALDDFGTGYSSLYHLRELKLDKIKIDRSFIQSMKDNPESAKIVYGILGLAKSLALPTTAEGIEDSEILDRLNKAGCEIGQGYHFGKAMPAIEASQFVCKSRGKAKLLVA
ncbi:putative bifunctional diguanylate cyclase/phosphodiesterase [Mesorhizobium helmanticense]|uniref:GGDEF-domain containing protein n=1 Tax=Mesorhizobium helmanticense TaxID=1776423 RepID=A0A2T4IRB0_9HYPH|nr:EAL domain-containing protein [Mesorhizobium helmanticense]PTE08170.1 GGDEF-domain containing protein [Mesorhizobium helmanticense]